MLHHRTRILFIWVFACVACQEFSPEPFLVENNQKTIERGAQLVHGMAACGFCHSAQSTPSALLSGGSYVSFDENEILAPNLTSDQGALAKWSDNEIAFFMRGKALSRPGVSVQPFYHKGFEWIADEDLRSIIAYLRTLEPVHSEEMNKDDVSWFGQFIDFKILPQQDEIVYGSIPSLRLKNSSVYGGYLADTVARCGFCHSTPETLFSESAYLAGKRSLFFDGKEVVVPGLLGKAAKSGFTEWSMEEIRVFLKTGILPDGTTVNKNLCPIDFFARAPESEIDALTEYLFQLEEE